MALPKVVYIAGWGRSGSTLLARLLGAMDGFVAVGELDLICRPNWERWRCGCGSRTSDCDFWGRVLESAFGRDWRDGLQDLYSSHRRVVRHRHLRALLHPGSRPGYEAEVAAYGEIASRLYHAILSAANARVVVDESKLGVEALALARSGHVDLRVVHLVRDPRAVAHSWRRERPRAYGQTGTLRRHGAVRSTLEWSARNLVAEQARKVAPYRFVRYEDLAADPARVLVEVAELAGEPAALAFLENGSATLEASHAFAGNPMLGEHGPVSIRPDDEWRRAMPRAHRLLVAGLSFPMQIHYRRR